jgi:two-component system phosphate regulon sensor histidine kinase PhoR
MKKKIFQNIFWTSVLILAVSLGLVIFLLYDHFTSVEQDSLAAQTQLAARGVEEEGETYLKSLNLQNARITWIAADGTVKYDSAADAETMENHSSRVEFQQALASGSGSSTRYSTTIGKRNFYYALKLKDGTVLRMAIAQDTVGLLVVRMVQPILLIVLAALVLSWRLASRISSRMVEPLNKLDLQHPLENRTYDEVAPLLSRIDSQNREIEKQMDELKRRQNEFETITALMKEGLVLIDRLGLILSINPAAAKLLKAPEKSAGMDLLSLNRSSAMQKVLEDVLQGRGASAELQMEGGIYEVHANPVYVKDEPAGAVLVILDATERVRAEQQRREFSANVSHELKSPLQTIMGAAELLQNHMVKEEDQSRFLGQIMSESERLLHLIDDIIRLSQLDENLEVETAPVSLHEEAEEAVSTLRSEAQKHHVALHLDDGDAVVPGVQRMIYEIAYNLIDNAIRYNKDPGTVNIRILDGPASAALAVEDTGIGIARDQQERIFERFYRVDKSHSRQSGGTGLGLSIVKHAAQQHHAAIQVDSTLGKGTTITVTFPKTAEQTKKE